MALGLARAVSRTIDLVEPLDKTGGPRYRYAVWRRPGRSSASANAVAAIGPRASATAFSSPVRTWNMRLNIDEAPAPIEEPWLVLVVGNNPPPVDRRRMTPFAMWQLTDSGELTPKPPDARHLRWFDNEV